MVNAHQKSGALLRFGQQKLSLIKRMLCLKKRPLGNEYYEEPASRFRTHFTIFVIAGMMVASNLRATTTKNNEASSQNVVKQTACTTSSTSKLIHRIIDRCSHPLPHLLTQVVGKPNNARIIVSIWTSLMCPACHDMHRTAIPALIKRVRGNPSLCVLLQDNPIYPQSLQASAMVMACPPKQRVNVLHALFSKDWNLDEVTALDLKKRILGLWTKKWGVVYQDLEKSLQSSQETANLETCYHCKKKEVTQMKLKGAPYVVVVARENTTKDWSLKVVRYDHVVALVDQLLKKTKPSGEPIQSSLSTESISSF